MNEYKNRRKETETPHLKLEVSDASADRGVMEAVRDPLAVTTADGKITCVNAAMESATGFARSEMAGTDLAGYFTRPEDARAAQQRALAGGFIPDCELELQHRDGHRTPVLCNLAVQRDHAGKLSGLVVAMRNLGALKRAEEELKRLDEDMEGKIRERTAQLEAANKELEAFAYSVAHDLRAPLRSIDTVGRRLQAGHAQQLDAHGRADLENILGTAGRMGELIEDLLKLSSAMSRHVELEQRAG